MPRKKRRLQLKEQLRKAVIKEDWPSILNLLDIRDTEERSREELLRDAARNRDFDSLRRLLGLPTKEDYFNATWRGDNYTMLLGSPTKGDFFNAAKNGP